MWSEKQPRLGCLFGARVRAGSCLFIQTDSVIAARRYALCLSTCLPAYLPTVTSSHSFHLTWPLVRKSRHAVVILACFCFKKNDMMPSAAGPDNPFRDVSDSLVASAAPSQSPSPALHLPEGARETTSVADTLNVGSTASLTLGTDSLVVLGMQFTSATPIGQRSHVLQTRRS